MALEVNQLSKLAFKPYGSYMFPDQVDLNQAGQIAYYPDQIVSVFEASSMVSISLLFLEKRDFSFDIAEYHQKTEEIVGGFPQDVLFHVALPSKKAPQGEDFKVFRLPAGGFVRFKRKVWHHAPFPTESGRIHGIVILPPFTYTHDSFVIQLENKVEIKL